ncbi:methyltransferase domain-containing protein [Chlorogloea sp. CCALA 695]|uniref:methyltransferase domain-containing protein n=1 Tax=Chlorogloea sp. CCALA 695 TaxID=2107693 RepID=UPI000D053653|nr:methyltransferase domain-containing protein [Chlorogloea sp. CCALA 695]PSB33976.1 SAM-dependent methyltransferase [Chlorogloea sp. CCALA 695]
MTSVANFEYWENRYIEGKTGWDLGQAAPPFVSLLNSPAAPKAGKIAVLGSGSGYDALLFAQRGFEVIGFDFAPSAIASATELAQNSGISAQFLQRNIFDLPAEFPHYFDYVLEHTCFCAIEPRLRPAYVNLVKSLLKPSGELIALFWAHNLPGGPPFGTTTAEIHQYFEPDFKINSLTLANNSVSQRQEQEYLGRFIANS